MSESFKDTKVQQSKASTMQWSKLAQNKITVSALAGSTLQFSYWTANIGMIGPQHWQPPQKPMFAAGIWQYCGIWKGGINGAVKRGGGGTEKGEVEWGWVDVGLAPDCEFLSVKIYDSLVGTLSLGQSASSLSSFTSTLVTSSSCSSFLIITSSFTFKDGNANSTPWTATLP